MKTDLQSIFGEKFSGDFPNQFLVSQTCGDGFYSSTGGGRYNQGISLNVATDTVCMSVFRPLKLYTNYKEVTSLNLQSNYKNIIPEMVPKEI